MGTLEYRELKIRLTRDPSGGFTTSAEGPTGRATGTFALPFPGEELTQIIDDIAGQVGRGTRRIESPDYAMVKNFGGALFDALFQGEVRDLYHSSTSAAQDQGKGLRITLALTDVPELMQVPWEFLYDKPHFLAISDLTPIVRYLDLRKSREPIEIKRPLRILGMVSSPLGVVPLDVEREKAKIERAVGKLVADGAVEITWLEQATLDELQRCLRGGPYHVFHYIGHGEYDEEQEDGVLLLEDTRGRPDPVSGLNLGATLAIHPTLRLATLNACEGGWVAGDDPFSGVATSLVQSQIPAVIAMQFEITDRMAEVFSEWLYESLAAGYPVDRALAQTRLAIFNQRRGLEWGTPVLFMRVQDGRIFDIPAAPPPRPVPPPPPEDGEPKKEWPFERNGRDEEEEEPEPKPEPEPEPWWRRHRTAVLIAAVVVALLIAAVVVAYVMRDGGGASDEWRLETSLNGARLKGVAAAPELGAIAVGRSGSNPAVWTREGEGWAQQPVIPGSGVMNAVVVSGGTAVAGGNVVDQERDLDAGLWTRSADGRWQRTCSDRVCGDGAPDAGRRQEVNGITITDAGRLVAVGMDTRDGSREAAVWTSEDGSSWTRIDRGQFGGSEAELMYGVAAAGNALVAVGVSGRDGAAWRSVDGGSNWTKVPDEELDALGRSVEVLAVCAVGSRFVAVGRERRERGQRTGAVAWYSGDGRSWARSTVEDVSFSGQQMTAVVSTSDGLFAVGGDRAKSEAAVWRSADGKGWRRVSSASFANGALPAMRGIDLFAESTLLAVGSSGSTGLFWASTDVSD